MARDRARILQHIVRCTFTSLSNGQFVDDAGLLESRTWSRGQSWGVYGYAQMYNSTKIEAYLDTARNMAEWYLTHLPSVGVAYW